MRRIVILWLSSVAACIDTGQHEVEVPLSVTGTTPSAEIVGRDGVRIVLARADLAFGPLVLCAGTQAGELCETARVEWLDAVVVDALGAEAQQVGALSGVSGSVQSFMYDLGYVSRLTLEDPLELSAAESLDGASVIVEGMVTLEQSSIPFAAALQIRTEEDTERGVPVVRKSSADTFAHVIVGDETLTVTFDPVPWIDDVDFAALRSDDGCTPPGTVLGCRGDLEVTCDQTGTEVGNTDCAAADLYCTPGLGCVEQLDLTLFPQAASAIRTRIVAGPRPAFTWD